MISDLLECHACTVVFNDDRAARTGYIFEQNCHFRGIGIVSILDQLGQCDGATRNELLAQLKEKASIYFKLETAALGLFTFC